MSTYTIKQGQHRAKPLRLGLYLNKKNIAFKVLFDTSCKYHIDGEDMEDINKLFGISYVPWYMVPLAIFSSVFLSLFRNQHHKDSARFGWRHNDKLNRIEILAYCYVNGVRKTAPVISVPFNNWFIAKIEIYKDESDRYKNECAQQAKTIEGKDERIKELEQGINNFLFWLKEKRPSMTGNGAPISILQNLLSGEVINLFSIETMQNRISELEAIIDIERNRSTSPF